MMNRFFMLLLLSFASATSGCMGWLDLDRDLPPPETPIAKPFHAGQTLFSLAEAEAKIAAELTMKFAILSPTERPVVSLLGENGNPSNEQQRYYRKRLDQLLFSLGKEKIISYIPEDADGRFRVSSVYHNSLWTVSLFSGKISEPLWTGRYAIRGKGN